METDLVHAAVTPEPKSGAIITPLFLSTTFVQDSVAEYLQKGYSSSRTNNPTVTALETKLATLENGAGAAAFGTGMAATTSAISATMKAGDHCVISDCSYGGTNRSCREFFTPLGMEFSFVDFRDPENVNKSILPRILYPIGYGVYVCGLSRSRECEQIDPAENSLPHWVWSLRLWTFA